MIPRLPSPRRLRGFTLAEVMIGCVLGSLVLAGVLSAFLMLGRSGRLLYNYANMSADARRGLEEFAQDVRMASALTLNSTSSVTLTVPDNYAANGNQVTYAFGNVTIGTTPYSNCFYRRPGTASSTATATVLVRNVTDCAFSRFDVLGAVTASDAATKRLELAVHVSTTAVTVATATDNILSATYVLRNK